MTGLTLRSPPGFLSSLGTLMEKEPFFCIGDNVRKYQETFSLLEKEHRIANHTFNHLSGWTTSTPRYIENLKKCQIQMVHDNGLFRPPYGRIKASQARLIREDYDIIMWDLLSGDFDKRINPKLNSKKIIELAKPGSIIVFHDSVKAWENLKVMLPIVLEGLSKKGFTFGAIPKLNPNQS